MKQNVTMKNKVSVQYVGSKKTVTYTLTNTQKQAIIDGLEVAGNNSLSMSVTQTMMSPC